MPQGTIVTFNGEDRTGKLLTDQEEEVLIDAGSLEGAAIRLLRIGQRVKFDVADEGGKKVARTLRMVTFD